MSISTLPSDGKFAATRGAPQHFRARPRANCEVRITHHVGSSARSIGAYGPLRRLLDGRSGLLANNEQGLPDLRDPLLAPGWCPLSEVLRPLIDRHPGSADGGVLCEATIAHPFLERVVISGRDKGDRRPEQLLRQPMRNLPMRRRQRRSSKLLILLAHRGRFELPTPRFVV
jgi:hypothetical protein